VTVTFVVFGRQRSAFTLWAVTRFESDPLFGEKVLLLKPAAYHVDRADETVMPTMFGTVMSGLLHPGGPEVVTVTVAVATRQPPGLDAGVVFCAVTVSVS